MNVSVGNGQADTSSFTGSWGELRESEWILCSYFGFGSPFLSPSSSSSFVTNCSQGRTWVCCAHMQVSIPLKLRMNQSVGSRLRAALGLCDFLTPSLSSSFPSTGLCGSITPPFPL